MRLNIRGFALNLLTFSAVLFACAEARASVLGAFPEERTVVFPLKKRPLDGRLDGMALLEGGVRFEKRAAAPTRIPEGLTGAESADIQLSPGVSIAGLRGRDASGRLLYFFDRNSDGSLADESPAVFVDDGESPVSRLTISYPGMRESRAASETTTLVLRERKPGQLEYHFDEAWETKLEFGGETLSVALQRFPILFLDVKYSGLYEKVFFPEREILGFGGRFFRLEIDLPGERLILKETDKAPVDAGYPAPEFNAAVWGSERSFRLSEHRGKTVVLTFWSPLCSGSKAEAALYDRLARDFTGDDRIRFIASIKEAGPLQAYLKDHPHAFIHVVGLELWDTYGVTAPFVTFLIDSSGRITKRLFGYGADLEKNIRELIGK